MKVNQLLSSLALASTALGGPPGRPTALAGPPGRPAALGGPPGRPVAPVSSIAAGRPTSSSTNAVSSTSSAAQSSSTLSSANATSSVTPNCVNSPTSRGCWGNGFNINTDREVSWPSTGNTVSYTFHIQNVTLSPDGTPKQFLAVNGQIPGPTIEANWGDMIQVTVYNDMQSNGTSMHWHGVRQLNTADQDGTNGVSECSLAPGDSKTYLFQATEYGTSWYHSHFSAQYGDGVQGPIIIHGPASADYDEDLGTIMINDLYPQTVFQEAYLAERTGDPLASNYLLNGMNVKLDGSAGKRFQQTFIAGKKYLIRLINTSVENFMTVAIDGHTMTVISSDFVPIKPYTTNGVKINIGQRYDVIVTANQPVSNYWLRAMVGQCSRNANNGLGSIANGIITYQGASNGTLPKTSPASFSGTCADEPAASLVPIVTKSVDSSSFVSQVQILPAGPSSISNANGTVFRWTLNGISEVINWAEPTLIDIASGQNNFSLAENVVTLPTANIWVYFVVESRMPMEHPFHVHGHDFSILGTGSGTFSTSQTSELNFASPVRRDVTTLPASGWTVIAFKTDNPGAWLLHCHIAWHVSEGLSIQFLEVPSQIPAKYPVSAEQQQTCANWKAYEASDPVYTQADSGLKRRHLVRHARHHSSHRAF